jgi:hypothetical protein
MKEHHTTTVYERLGSVENMLRLIACSAAAGEDRGTRITPAVTRVGILEAISHAADRAITELYLARDVMNDRVLQTPAPTEDDTDDTPTPTDDDRADPRD